MTPSVLEILTHRLADRLWHRWFAGAFKSPWEAHLTPPTNRLAQIRQRRGRLLADLVWVLLRPLLPWLARVTAWLARRRLRQQQTAKRAPSGQSIAIGNWIAAIELQARGLSPAILSRGYRARAPGPEPGGIEGGKKRTRVLQPEHLSRISPAAAGDEAWLMAWRTGCPVGVGADRSAAADAVRKHYPQIDVWLLDDGLSQTSMRPDHRILVLDDRGHGTGKPMPDGPLRGAWPPPPGHTPDAIVAPSSLDISRITADLSGDPPHCMARDTRPAQWLQFPWGPSEERSPEKTAQPHSEATGLQPESLDILGGPPPAALLQDGPFLAIAGIAQPEVFFQMLRDLGLPLVDTLSLPDHAPEIFPWLLRWKAAHPFLTTPSIVMTEKDAVKFAWELRQVERGRSQGDGSLSLFGSPHPHWWAVRLQSHLPDDWLRRITQSLKQPPRLP